MGRPKGSGKLGPYRETVIAKVRSQPDITMPDRAAWLLSEHGVGADPSTLSKLLCRAGFSYKKRCWRRRKNALTSRPSAMRGASAACQPCARHREDSSSSTRPV